MKCKKCEHYAGYISLFGIIIIKCNRLKIENKDYVVNSGKHHWRYLPVLMTGKCPTKAQGSFKYFKEKKMKEEIYWVSGEDE